MMHGGETWGPNAPELQRLRRNDRAMIRWICGVKARDEVPSDQLLLKLGIGDIISSTGGVLLNRRLRWAGHVRRATSCIRDEADRQIPGSRGRGRPVKTWWDCVAKDLVECDLSGVDPLDRDAWRMGVRQSLVLPTP